MSTDNARRASLSLHERLVRSIEAQREGFTMVLYMAIITLAVLVADGKPGSAGDDIALIIGTAVGTLGAHLLAFRLAANYFQPDSGESGQVPEAAGHDQGASIYALIAATVLVVVIAVLPYLVFPLEVGNVVSTALLSLIIGGSAWAVAKAGKRSDTQALIYAVGVTVLALGIAVVKDLLVH